MLRGCTPPKEEYKQQKGQNNLQNKITPPENLLPPNKTKTNKQKKQNKHRRHGKHGMQETRVPNRRQAKAVPRKTVMGNPQLTVG